MKVGIVAYGAYLPKLAISAQEIATGNGQTATPDLGVKQKTVPDLDEDTITIATEASQLALLSAKSADKLKKQIGCLFIGSESHPYAVKPSGTVVASALGLSTDLSLADLQFACKAGTQGLQIALMYVLAGQIKFGLAVGADTAQAAPGDVLEYTAAAGGAAFVVGTSSGREKIIAELLGTSSYATDTPDFWRRPQQTHPSHGGRFTGGPAYFAHISQATKALLKKLDLKPEDFTYAIFHTPNGKFPVAAAKQLGFNKKQLSQSLIVEKVGNTYAAATLLALANVLDHAKPGDKILMTSYGSGAGADSFAFVCTPALLEFRKRQSTTIQDYLARLQLINYLEYRQRSGQ